MARCIRFWGGCLEGCYTSACDDNAVTEACKENSRAACEDADGLTLKAVGILSEIRSTGARHINQLQAARLI